MCDFEAAYLYKGYVKYLVLLRWLTRTEIIASLAHTLIASAVAPLTFLIARRLNSSAQVAWTAGMAAACLPYYVFCVSLQPQVAFTIALSALSVWIFVVWRDRSYDLLFGVLYALVWSYLAYCRPNAAILVPFTFAIYLTERYLVRPGQRRPLEWLTPGLVAALVILAFYGMSIENNRIYHRYRPFAPTFGYNLYLGNNEHVRADLARTDIEELENGAWQRGDIPSLDNYGFAADDQLSHKAEQYIVSHPAETLRNSVVKAFRYWGFHLHKTKPISSAKNALYLLPYLIYGPLALVGIFFLAVRKRYFALLVTVGIIAVYWASHVAFFSIIRFRMTTEYLVLLLAAEGVWCLFRRSDGNLHGPPSVLQSLGDSDAPDEG